MGTLDQLHVVQWSKNRMVEKSIKTTIEACQKSSNIIHLSSIHFSQLWAHLT